MQIGTAAVMLLTLGACYLAGCSRPEPADAARQNEVKRESHRERSQRSIDRRLLRLENQALSELRQLRESRLASAGVTQLAGDEKPASGSDYELLVFGGGSHEVFLGCLCDEHHSDSVFNMLGEHGSHLSSASIRNKFAPYGSNYDDTSACNAAATHPPAVVASDGKSLGLLTLNTSLKKRITAPSVADWLARMCGE